MSTLLFLISALFGVVAYSCYFKDIKKKGVANNWSWIIWCVTTIVESLTFDEVSGDILKTSIFYLSAACCVVIMARLCLTAVWEKPDWTEIFCVIVSLVALILWLYFKLTLWAHLLTVLALPVAFFPTWKSAWKDYRKDDSQAWMLWTIGDIFALSLILFRLEDNTELPYIIIETLCHGVTWVIISIRRKASSPNG